MPRKKPHSGSRRDLIEQVEQLAAKVRSLQEPGAGREPASGPRNDARKDTSKDANAEGLAEGIVAALGRMIPGLGKLIEAALQAPEFRQKLAGIDEEVRRRFKEQPLRQASLGLAGSAGRRQIGIPPSVRRSAGGRVGPAAGASGPATGKTATRGSYRAPRPLKMHLSPETPAQLAVDVFDEGKRVVVLAEAPGLSAEDITVSLDGTVLVISVHSPQRKGLQRIELPCEVAGQPEMTLANGILNVQMRKVCQS